MTRPRIALFGGTFDPVHSGHLLLAESARRALHLNQVIFIPAGTPPHKSVAVASPARRLRMVRLATRSNPFFKVSDWEIRKKRVVYSYETAEHFRKRFPKAQLFFIVGTDMLRTLPSWKNTDRLLKACTFLAVERPGVPWSRLSAGVRRKAQRVDWRAVPFASHEIRARVRRGQSINEQVPKSVERYLRAHRVYA